MWTRKLNLIIIACVAMNSMHIPSPGTWCWSWLIVFLKKFGHIIKWVFNKRKITFKCQSVKAFFLLFSLAEFVRFIRPMKYKLIKCIHNNFVNLVLGLFSLFKNGKNMIFFSSKEGRKNSQPLFWDKFFNL